MSQRPSLRSTVIIAGQPLAAHARYRSGIVKPQVRVAIDHQEALAEQPERARIAPRVPSSSGPS